MTRRAGAGPVLTGERRAEEGADALRQDDETERAGDGGQTQQVNEDD